MAIISVSGETGCPYEEQAGLQRLIEAEFPATNVPEKAWKYVLQLIVARLSAAGKHVVVCAPNASGAIRDLPQSLRVNVTGASRGRPHHFDLVLNCESFNALQMLEIVHSAITARCLDDAPPQTSVEFNARLKLAKFGISPPQNGRAAN